MGTVHSYRASDASQEAQELARLLTHCVARTTPEELVQLVNVTMAKHVWPTFATRTMMRTMVRELSASKG